MYKYKFTLPQGLLALALLVLAGSPLLHAQPLDPLPEEYDFREDHGFKYVVYAPKAAKLEAGKKYPMVLYLHGSCSECTTQDRITWESNLQFWHNYQENTQEEPTFLIAPAGGTGGWTSEAKRSGVMAIVDEIMVEYPIDPQRVYITGFSMGGSGTWNYIQQRPDFFAAANPQGSSGGSLNTELLKDFPIWTTAGSLDTNAANGLMANVTALRAANGDNRGALAWVTGVNPRINIFPGVDHGGAQVATQSIPDFKQWMYSQKRDGNTAPVVRFVTPQRLDFFESSPAQVGVAIATSDADGPTPTIELEMDGVPVSNWNGALSGTISVSGNGKHLLSAIATDSGNKKSMATIEIAVGTPVQEVTASASSIILDEGSSRAWSVILKRVGESPDTTYPININLNFGGTATFGEDYGVSLDFEDGHGIIPAGKTSGNVRIVSTTDELVEGDESIVVSIAPGDGYVYDPPAQATATIGDNDAEADSPFGQYPETVEGNGLRNAGDDSFGWVWDQPFPFVYSWKLNTLTDEGWMYVHRINATPESFFAFSFGENTWFWASLDYTGWIYLFDDQGGTWTSLN